MTITGYIKDAVSLEPVPGATISAYIAAGVQLPLATADELGFFQVDDKNMGLVISAIGYAPEFVMLPHTSGLTYRLDRDYRVLPGVVITAPKKKLLWMGIALLLLFSFKK